MTRACILALAIIGATVTLSSVIAAGPEETIQNAIADLDRAPHAGFDVLWQHPQKSTELLVAVLAPVARGAYPNGSHPPVVWYLRALRSLTGLNFRGPTNERLTEDEEHWLRPRPDRSVEFFGTWMSRDRVWVAPEDAQADIIRQWKQWFAANGTSHRYVNDRNVDNWYF
jgi:hypothetical protein